MYIIISVVTWPDQTWLDPIITKTHLLTSVWESVSQHLCELYPQVIVAATQTNQPVYCWNFTIQTILLDYTSDYIIKY